jgi:hypothetical protein
LHVTMTLASVPYTIAPQRVLLLPPTLRVMTG